MTVVEIVVGCILGVLAIALFILSARQFACKGVLLNNMYVYSTPKERDAMDKRLYYKQSGVVLVFVGAIMLLNALSIFLRCKVLSFIAIGLVLPTIIYAIASTVIIERKKKVGK